MRRSGAALTLNLGRNRRTMEQIKTARWSRILVKLSGEALLGQADYGIDPVVIRRVAGEVGEVQALGVQVAIVIGGGNLFRGAGLARAGMDRVTADQMGMLATVMNALALQDALEHLGGKGPRSVRDPHQRGLRGLHPPPRHPSPREGTQRHLCRRHRQPVLHHRHGREPASDRDRGAAAAESHQGERHLFGRPDAQPRRSPLSAAHLRSGPR